MISINDFKVGDTAYMLDTSRRVDTLCEVTIEKVGRKYVTARINKSRFAHEFYVGFSPYALVEKTDYSVNLYLFQSQQKYEEYKEIKELGFWLRNAVNRNYTLDQLRKVREILDTEEVTE